MRFASVCAGIEAASQAWAPLGWSPAWYAEIDAFASALLAERHGEVANLGDMSEIRGKEADERYGPVDLLVGGTPCQSFSVAGLRAGLDDPRGNLALEFLRLADELRPRWLVWENVPGVLSSNGGRDYGALLGGLAELGYGFAYRVLDAQYFGLAQRRKRVFLVAHLGDWRAPAAVLLERSCLRGDPAPSRDAGPAVAALTATGAHTCGADDNQAQAGHLIAETIGGDVAHTLRGEGFDASEDGTGRGVPIVMATGQANAEIDVDRSPTLTLNRDGPPIAFHPRQDPIVSEDVSHAIGCHTSGSAAVCVDIYNQSLVTGQTCTLTSGGVNSPPGVLAFDLHGSMARKVASKTDLHSALRARSPGQIENSTTTVVADGVVVRRLTPVECERLMGFPDDYTRVPYRGKPADRCPDGPRYRALGNSIAVPVLRWIGERISAVESSIQGRAAS